MCQVAEGDLDPDPPASTIPVRSEITGMQCATIYGILFFRQGLAT